MFHDRRIRADRVFGTRGMSGLLAASVVLVSTPIAVAQMGDLAPVALDDSPVAERLLAEVEAQAADNPERSAALLADLLDEYADRVVVTADDPDRFESVRQVVLRVLADDGAIRDAWRARHEAEAATILAEDGAEACLRRRPLTDAGLEAGLRIAQRTIESGDPGNGRRLLAGLADWPGAGAAEVADRRAVLEVLAWIAIAVDDPSPATRDARDAAIEVVRLRDAGLADRLAAIAAADPPGDGRPTASPFDRDWTALWEVPLEASLHRQRTVDVATGRTSHPDPDGVRLDGRYLVTVPAVAGDLVLVNEGRLLEGIDRYTGRLLWYRDHGIGRMTSRSGIPGDLCEIVVVDGDAYTITGHALPGDRGADRSIVRFDPATGLEQWMVRPDRLADHPELEDTVPSGPPLVVGDLVVVPLRRMTARLETIDLVIALDRTDGAVRWVRTLASSGSMRVGDPRAVSRLAAIDGDVLAASTAGAVVRLDGRSGDVVWLQREEVPLRGPSRVTLPWGIAGPVVVGGRIATLDAARRHWRLLDPESGREMLKRPLGVGTAVGNVNWLAAVQGVLDGRDLLLAIGDDVVAIDPDAPDEPVWSWRRRAEADGVDLGDAISRLVRGRVFVDASALLVPTTAGVHAVDPRTGRTARLIEFDGPVNPVLLDDAIIAAGPDGLITAMPVAEAVATLEERLRATPGAVPQAITLLELASRFGRSDLLRFAATTAVDGLAMPGGDAWRTEVLDLLLEIVPSANDEDGVALLDLAAQAAVDVAGRVRHRLARASWLESRGRTREAADAWLGVMGDGDASAVLVRSGETLDVSAGAVARQRLVLALGRDPALRDRLESEAVAEVEAAIASRETARALVDLARRWPGTAAAITAASRAIEILRDEGDPSSVLAVGLVVARDLASDDPRRAILLEKAAVACDESAAAGSAAVLRRAAGETSASTVPRARLEGTPDHLELLAGRLAPVAPEVRDEAPPDLVVLFDPNAQALVALDVADFQERWRFPVEREHRIVGWSPDLLVWEGIDRREPVLTALDPETGEPRWSAPQPTQVLPPISRFAVQSDGFLPGGDVFLSYQVLPRRLAEGMLLVRRDGAASMLDPVDGRTVLWSRRDLLERVYGVTSGGGLVHLHGAGIDDRGEKVGRVVSIDPATGRTVLDEIVPAGEVQWLVAGDLGRIAIGTRTEIRLLDPIGGLLGGGDAWTRRDSGLGGRVVGWMTPRDLAVADDSGRMSAWSLADGRTVADRWLLPEDGPLTPGAAVASIDLGDTRVLHLDGRLVAHDAEGRLRGADALGAPSRRDWRVVPIDGGVLLATWLSSGSGANVIRFQRFDPDAGLRLVGQPFEIAGRTRYEDIRAVNGRLLLSTEDETHVLPMSPPREVAPDSDAGP